MWTWAAAHEFEAPGLALVVFALAVATTPILGYPYRAAHTVIGAWWAVRTCGLVKIWPRGSDVESKGWNSYLGELQAAGPDKIRIMAFTGASTFSTKEAPLSDVLIRHRGDVENLLANPESSAFRERVELFTDNWNTDLGSAMRQCDDQVQLSRKYCQDLLKHAPEVNRVEVRTYDFPAIWKMVIFHNCLWAQYYRPAQRNADMPAYVFRAKDNGDGSLFLPLERTFTQYWTAGKVLVKVVRGIADKKGESPPSPPPFGPLGGR